MSAQLVTDALLMAISRRGRSDALLHHSDSQRINASFRALAQTLIGRLVGWPRKALGAA